MDQSNDRIAEIVRTTKETQIRLRLNLDGDGQAAVSTQVGFLDHMLTLFTVHGFFDLEISALGDVEIDDHHTVEDIGICLGKAFSEALGDKAGICRYGHSYVPMDETLTRVCVDFSNRFYLHYESGVLDQKVGTFDTALAKEFLRAFALHAGVTLHVDVLHGENTHHILESVFKALARAVSQACSSSDRIKGQLSSKGML
ncbi:imidazoleglycerol-phosphate dehydratase HisB [Desulfogranum japonicum]|uniref:imidazoleglycerol-phosphate dehydratase HisB n=1 Tax=Desulfogranum japonicum TaxID=231447 RepID=UPI0003F89AF8|nr:imidazoleglycerol-phosphate dehydratase HisB [Desulfogranum japonicum]